jgi:multimeric flavodoxin WrbA
VKTLIINGSPRRNGDTAFLLAELKNHLRHEVVELSAYYDAISPCVDCRACTKKKGCIINDRMQLIYEDDYDNIVIASPIYMSNLTPPLMSIASRFQAYYCAKRFLRDEFIPRAKKSALILVGGGDGGPREAIRLSEWMFKKLNAAGHGQYTALSLKTDAVPSSQDEEAVKQVKEIARYFNGR